MGPEISNTPSLPGLKLKGGKYLKMTSRQVLDALRRKHPAGKFVFLEEVAFATGFVAGSDNHADAIAFGCWPSAGLERVAYEVKVSREDFKRELKKPGKRKRAMELCHLFYFATPKGMLDPEDLPIGCGLVEVYETGETREKKAAIYNRTPGWPYEFFLSSLRKSADLTLRRRAALGEHLRDQLRTIHGWDRNLFEQDRWDAMPTRRRRT